MSIQCLPHTESEDRSAELTFNSVVKVCLLFPMEDGGCDFLPLRGNSHVEEMFQVGLRGQKKMKFTGKDQERKEKWIFLLKRHPDHVFCGENPSTFQCIAMLRMKRQNVTHSEAEVQKSTKIPSLKGMITFFCGRTLPSANPC